MSEEYIRPDGRTRKALRDLKIEVGILDRADGSSRVYLGRNIAVATIFGPREMHPKHAARADRAQMRINYRMATFSVDDYKRPYPSRREKEISKVLSEAFESLVLLENWPRSVIDVHVQLFQSDGGTRTAAAIAISAALADAGIPMRDLPAGIATGLYEDQVCLDLTGHEDMKGEGDMPIMYAPSVDEISLFQLDGQFTFEQFKEAYFTSIDAIREISQKIKEAVKAKYLLIRDQYLDDEEEEIDHSLLEDEEEDEEEEEEEEETESSDTELDEPSETPAPVAETPPMPSTEMSEETRPEEATTAMSSESSEIESSSTTEETTAIESESDINNRWFAKRGGELQPMTANENRADEEDEENEDDTSEDNNEETSGILRDLEYSYDEEE
jgi:exosome complex component RRP41